MNDEQDTHDEAARRDDAPAGWNRSHLLVHALWFTTLLPVGLPEASATWGVAAPAGTVTSGDVTELSGLAVSAVRPGYMYGHNDSGDSSRVYVLRRDGEVLGWIKLNIKGAYDWEDIAVGPCEAGSTRSCIYVGDIGDNRHQRESVWVWKIEEPDPEEVARRGTLHVDPEHVWVFTHEGRAHDAEGLFVDPETARVYVVQKTRKRRVTRVMELPEASPGAVTRGEARAIGALDLTGERTRSGRLATAADMARGERACVGVRTYSHMWTACSEDPGASVRALLEGSWERTHVGAMFQSEALAFEEGGRGALISSEGWLAPIVRVPWTRGVR
jgi:hypothetical protein